MSKRTERAHPIAPRRFLPPDPSWFVGRKCVAPGVDFGQAGKTAVRFSYVSSEENIREAARRLAVYLGKR